MEELSDRAKIFRSAIVAFIDARRDAKVKGEGSYGAASKYAYGVWLADAGRRVGQIQIVTHILKATHPDARGSSLYVVPGELPQHSEVGSHVLGEEYVQDVVGNAAALDVFKFLMIEVEGQSILNWAQDGDDDLRCAFSIDAVPADGLMRAFSALANRAPQLTSHRLAKQVYWLVGDMPADDSQYHLLQPMFSSSLAQVVHADIQEARFGEANKLARHAWRSNEQHENSYRDYRDLVARKLGGTKPQNVSLLNSERRGTNYLLASLPPRWALDRPHSLLNLESAMERLAYYKPVRQLVDALAELLLSNPPANEKTRRARRSIEQELGAQLGVFAAETRAHFEPGWTRDPQCVLSPCEKQWLDPERAELPPRVDPDHPEWTKQDHDFKAASLSGDWQNEVAGRFANWVNARFHAQGMTTVGDAEYKHWAKQAIVDAELVPLQQLASLGAAQ